MSAPSSKWLVIATHPHRELFAISNLKRQDFDAYCPMIMKRIRHARRVYDDPRPLFPGYIFVAFQPAQNWRPILGTYGVKSLVRNGEEPGLLGGSFIDAMKSRERDGVIRKLAAELEAGQRVEVQGGPFDGLVGEILELRDKERVLVLLNMLDQQTKTHLRVDMLNPIDPDTKSA
jgi:transcriptional antiterminator RfaH